MKLISDKRIRCLWLVGLGVLIGATGGTALYSRSHPPFRQRPDVSAIRGSGISAPPELRQIGKTEAPIFVEPIVVAATRPEGPEFFGFRVATSARAPEPRPATLPDPLSAPKSVPAPALIRLRLMKGRCVGGFDGTSPVLDFSGWTRSIAGELTYEKGRLAETAKGHVTADPATLDTGDAARDREIREKILETAKYPEMNFDVSTLEMTGVDTMNMSGTMEIHGRTRIVTIPCRIRLRRDGYAWMKGEIRVNMSAFGIKPPVKLAVIKVADEIRIWFEIWAEPVREPKK